MTDRLELEKELAARDVFPVCGCDEAGAGPLAGPVYAGAVILPLGLEIPGLDDSKKLSEKKREALYDVITEQAVAWAVACVSPEEVDEINILNARLKAMDIAIRALAITPAYALIDGNQNRGISIPNETVLKGDSRVWSIAAASILAKVTRDRLMLEYDKKYPQYGFAKHKGYGTKEHYDALREFGPCPIHRMSFLKKFFAEGNAWTKSLSGASENSPPQNI